MGISAQINLPSGTGPIPYSGVNAPAGWLMCDGSAVSRVTYAALFAAIGVAFGGGDGVNTFNLPDCRGRAVFGRDDMGGVAANRLTAGNSGVSGNVRGAVGGGEMVTLSQAQMPVHTHTSNSVAGGGAQPNYTASSNGATLTYPYGGISNAGSGSAHPVIPPALVTNYIIKT